MIKRILTAFIFMFLALAYGHLTGFGPLSGTAYARETMPDSGEPDPDGGGDDDNGGGPDDTDDDGGCGGGGGGGEGGSGSDPDGSGGGGDF